MNKLDIVPHGCGEKQIDRKNFETKFLSRQEVAYFFIAKNCVKMIKDEEIKDFFKFLISNKSSGAFTSNLNDYVVDARHMRA